MDETAAASRDALLSRCAVAIWAAEHRLRGTPERSWLELDLTVAQLKALVNLRIEGPQTVSGLAGHLGVTEPSASQLIERLHRRGLVQRKQDPGDRRRSIVSVTPKGDALVDPRRAARDATIQEWLSLLPDPMIECLVQGLEALVAVADAQTEDTGRD